MEFVAFQVTNYRNILDSGRIEVSRITAFVGQNEAGKSNLFDALYRVNPFAQQAAYNLDEDWPVDKWGEKDPTKHATVCKAEFQLESEEISSLYAHAAPQIAATLAANGDAPVESEAPAPQLPDSLTLVGVGAYGTPSRFVVEGAAANKILDADKVNAWAKKSAPRFVSIQDVELSGHQMELDRLKQRRAQVAWDQLTNDEQTISVILDLAKINLDDLLAKGGSAEGRTTRTFDTRQASAFLTKQFQDLWLQKDVSFDIVVDATTLRTYP